MKFLIFLFLTAFAITIFVEAQDISNLLNDRRYVQKQINCILGQGHCDVVGRKIKEILPEALNNHCRRCTPRQMAHARTLIAFMKENYPNEWHIIVQRYTAMPYYKNYRRT
ncbi:ejaculatory bulb-specific protein 3-like isoform X1 [Osmia bicornis bicornis]|uniref:ejaculatory bulb-specific protein 3-like isoform X1 n=1 Tax=Osmia bicornis bicornis TaxID=1437191 RepID=UPI0010F87EC1|nr:ejaculatory bulb-specific protein 3-like isoform X1 [Osmia bicornis bicornis]